MKSRILVGTALLLLLTAAPSFARPRVQVHVWLGGSPTPYYYTYGNSYPYTSPYSYGQCSPGYSYGYPSQPYYGGYYNSGYSYPYGYNSNYYYYGNPDQQYCNQRHEWWEHHRRDRDDDDD